MIIMSVDLGNARTGIAVSDKSETFAFPKTVITEYNSEKRIKKIADAALAASAELIVVGLPKNMDGSLGFQSEYVLEFKSMLENEGIEVDLFDERLSTIQVTKIMIDADLSRQKRKQQVDKLAAVVILQSYLDSKKF